MSRNRKRNPKSRSGRTSGTSSGLNRHGFQRTDRVSMLIREIVATELERIDDDHLEGVAVTDVEVDRELSVAQVFYDVRDSQDAPEVELALQEHRHRLQRALGENVSMRRTPSLRFRLDTSVSEAERISRILEGINQADPDVSLADPDER